MTQSSDLGIYLTLCGVNNGGGSNVMPIIDRRINVGGYLPCRTPPPPRAAGGSDGGGGHRRQQWRRRARRRPFYGRRALGIGAGAVGR